jgi:hypothetical protein
MKMHRMSVHGMMRVSKLAVLREGGGKGYMVYLMI